MKTLAYLNGQYCALEEAKISPLDRGFTLGDGVYEVIPVFNRHGFHWQAHIDRLNQSLFGIRMKPVLSHAEWKTIFDTLIEKNESDDQWIYLQVTRGQDPIRDHQFPKDTKPTIFAVCYPKKRLTKEEQRQGLRVTCVRDIRWKNCHIKAISRLAYVLMYQEAKDAGYDEGIILHNGHVQEATISNIFLVRHGIITTPMKSNLILSGITRDCILSIAEKNRIQYRETKVTELDLQRSDEIWITSSTRGVNPVIELDGQPVGTGKAGPLWEKMWDLYAEEITNFSLSVSH